MSYSCKVSIKRSLNSKCNIANDRVLTYPIIYDTLPRLLNFMKKIHCFIVTLFLATCYLLLVTSPVLADGTCVPVYGGQSCILASPILINKTVQHPKTGSFVDNLGVNDPRFSPNQTVNFQLAVTNTGTSTIAKTTIKDTFPQFVSFVAGPGSFTNNVLSFEVDNLLPNETRIFTVTGKIADANSLPSDATITCVVNQATATTDNNQVSQDNAQVCIEKPVVTTKGGLLVEELPKKVFKTPPTGPEAIPLLALIPSAVAGIFLRKK